MRDSRGEKGKKTGENWKMERREKKKIRNPLREKNIVFKNIVCIIIYASTNL
jgi:hypothetical protein